MITFKKNWLYKYNAWCDGNFATIDDVNGCKSICPYFWCSMWNLFGTFSVYLLLAHLPALAGANLAKYLLGESFTGLTALYSSVGLGYVVLAAILGLCVGIGVSVHYISNITKNRQEKKPSVVVEYLKAKKSKICPMIKWED
ncbi:membrane protein [Vibrio phage K406]